jgi:transcriptional regulator with XRE-family HTH domain
MTRLSLREARAHRGMTQAELAKETGLLQGHISELERGVVSTPEIATMKKLAQALDMTALLSVQGLVFEERNEP